MNNEVDEFLQHYGVLGMKWGHRKDRKPRKSMTSESIKNVKKVTDASKTSIDQLNKLISAADPEPYKKKLNLNNMTDQQLRDAINRYDLEKRYNDIFAPTVVPEVSKGKRAVKKTLKATGDALALTSSALGVALAIKELKGK